jgi:hypothetical protein
MLQSFVSTAQEFAPIGAKWYYTRYQDGIPPSVFTGYVQLEAVRDTMILGNTCKLITKGTENNVPNENYYLYKDVTNKVFYYSIDSSRFCLLYDYNALVGDSFELDCIPDFNNNNEGGNLMVYIDSVAEININGEIKRMQLYRTDEGLVGFSFSGWVIEDIGHLFYLFPLINHNASVDYLRCYEDDSLGLYKPSTIACDYVTGIESLQENLIGITIYPTLVEDKINISNKNNHKINLRITSILGNQEFVQYNFIDKWLNLSELSSGVYFITVFDDEKQFTQKIIKL